MSESNLFGWDLLFKTIEQKIAREEDLIVALTHWYLTKHNFRCIGVGDDKTLNDTDSGSELLPDGWNDCEKSYALRYVLDGKLFILLATKTEDTLILNFLDVKTREVSNLAVCPKERVKSLRGSLKTMVPQISELLDRLKKELIEPVYKGCTREVTTQTRGESSRNHGRVYTQFVPDEPFGIPRSVSNPRRKCLCSRSNPLRDIGRGDLDPLARGGGGMILPQPTAPFGGDFGGAIGPFPPAPRAPPGARFDPFGPPERNIRPNPNRSDFRPPDFEDFYS